MPKGLNVCTSLYMVQIVNVIVGGEGKESICILKNGDTNSDGELNVLDVVGKRRLGRSIVLVAANAKSVYLCGLSVDVVNIIITGGAP